MERGQDSTKKYKKQSNFTEADIRKRLIGFKEVKNNDYSVLKAGMMCRYWTKKDGKRLFRMGGLLIYIDTQKGFLRLKNPSVGRTGLPWSVQLSDIIKIYYKDRVKENEERAKVTDQITMLMKKYNITLSHFEDLCNVFEGESGIDKNLDTIFNRYDANIENLIKEVDRSRRR
jgi:hypothetical protein